MTQTNDESGTRGWLWHIPLLIVVTTYVSVELGLVAALMWGRSGIVATVQDRQAMPADPMLISREDAKLLRKSPEAGPPAPLTQQQTVEFGRILERLDTAASKLLASHDDDEGLVRLNSFAVELLQAVREFPGETVRLREYLFDWHSAAQDWLASGPSEVGRRLIEENRRDLTQVLREVADAGLADDVDWPKPVPWLREAGSWSPDVYVRKLTSDDELLRTDAVDHLLNQGFEHVNRFLSVLPDFPESEIVLASIWENWPRVRLFHPKMRPVLAQLLERFDEDAWRRRMATLQLLQTVETADEVNLVLGRAPSEDLRVFLEILLIHPMLDCRRFALEHLPHSKRWNALTHRGTYMVIVREIVMQCCQDADDDYVKAVFLLLLPRLLKETSASGFREAYTIMSSFFKRSLFLQDTFFKKLVELRKSLKLRVSKRSALGHLEEGTEQSFKDFCAKDRLKDVDITRMAHVPLPIQRMLAHDGHFPNYFICNYRDPIALETILHVRLRPNVVDFLKLKRINAQALEKLAIDKLIMRAYTCRLAFCRNPRAKQKQLMEHLGTLRRTDLKALSRDRNVSTYAREHAGRIIKRAM